jgi:hypothetical protein
MKYENEQFINFSDGRVVEVTGAKDKEGQKIRSSTKNTGGDHQKWTVVYLDKADKVDDKGFDKEWGFHRNRPFYIRSRLPMKRVVECIGRNGVTQMKYVKNRLAQ